MSHSSMSAAEFGAENILRPLSQIRLGLERREKRQIPSLPAVLCHPAADQLQGWPKLILGKLIHQLCRATLTTPSLGPACGPTDQRGDDAGGVPVR